MTQDTKATRKGGEATPAPADPQAALTAALAAAQADFPVIEKRHTATVRPQDKPAYSYSYADLADVLAAVRPILSGHGLAVTQRTHYSDTGRLTLATELHHVGGGLLFSEVEIGQSPSSPQQFGGALTYLRRYELVSLLGIAAEEDRDAQDVEPPGRAAPPPPLPGWALHVADDGRKRALLDAVERLVGDRERAKGYLVTWRDACGGGVPNAVFGAVMALAAELAPPPAPEAEATRAAQDAIAERPDPPAAASEGDQLGAFDPLSGTLERQARLADEEPPTDAPASGPLPGTVEPPVGETTTAQWRALGCVCPDPESEPHEDACPIRGHGIPF